MKPPGLIIGFILGTVALFVYRITPSSFFFKEKTPCICPEYRPLEETSVQRELLIQYHEGYRAASDDYSKMMDKKMKELDECMKAVEHLQKRSK